MPTGLHVRNDTGSIQIDENYVNYFLLRKTNLTLKPYTYGTGVAFTAQLTQYNKAASTNILAYTCNTDGAIVSVAELPDSIGVLLLADVTCAITIFEFSELKNIPASSFGLAVYDAAANRVFDAAAKPMRIVGAYDLDLDNGENFTYTQAGKTIAACFMIVGLMCTRVRQPTPSTPNRALILFAMSSFINSQSKSTVKVASRGIFNSLVTNASAYNYTMSRCRGMALDVTNY